MRPNHVSEFNWTILDRLASFSRSLVSAIPLGETRVLELICLVVGEVMDAGNICIALHDQATDGLKLGWAMIDGENIPYGDERGWGGGGIGLRLAKNIIRAGQAQSANGTEDIFLAANESFETQFPGSWLGAPLMADRVILGAVILWGPKHPGLYGEDDVRLLTALVAPAGSALENARSLDGLKRDMDKQARYLKVAQEKVLISEVNTAVGLVATDIAHHSKNLAGIIRLCAMRLRRELRGLTSEQQTDLDLIARNSASILGMADRLFQPFRPEPKSEIGVDTLIKAALDALDTQDGIRIRVDIPTNLPQVNVQPQKAISCIIELLSNAVKFTGRRMKDSEIELLDIEILVQPAEEGYIEVIVTNPGPAIPLEDWERVFTLFSGHNEATQESSGYGLGLWGARTSMRSNGGDVRVLESGENRTSFVLRLPVR